MKIRQFYIIVSLILITSTVATSKYISKNDEKICNYLNVGWLEEQNGIKILHLNGSYYDMGYQHGILLKAEILANFNAFCSYVIEKGFTYEEIAHKWEVMEPKIPQGYIDEMNGMADATDLSFENISVFNIGFYIIVNCGSFAAWGSATFDKRLYHIRSHDFLIKIKDPESETYLVENQVIIIRQPLNQYSSVSLSVAGKVSASDGFNEKEIAAGMLSSWSDDEKFNGISVGFRVRMVLDFASTIDEALDIIISNKTLGYNFIVSDGKIPISYAVETTGNISYAGTWDNPIESTSPFWKIKNVVRRSNMFVDPTNAVTQRKIYDSSFFPLLTILFYGNLMSGTIISAARTWLHYVAISKGIESVWGNLDLNTSMSLLRNIYHGKTDIRFFIMQLFKMYSTPYQWVICPENGDFVLSFADRNKNAFENPVHYFNFYQLLNATPT
jgi:hypothetical protein